MLVLKPFLQPDLGLMMFKPGKSLLDELVRMSSGNRLLVAPLPKELVNVPSGKLNHSAIPNSSKKSLVDDERLLEFFLHADVQNRLGNFYHWLERIPHCQLSDGEFCDKNLTFLDCKHGALRLCWHHDNQERKQLSEQARKTARDNIMVWGVRTVAGKLRFDSNHQLTLPELFWWAVREGVYQHLPNSVVDQMFGIKQEAKRDVLTLKRESDPDFNLDGKEQLERLAKQVVRLTVNDNPPAMYMKRPKQLNWRSEKYLKFVRSLPCCATGRHGTDSDPVVAHHLIGHGEGKMGGKAHDLFTMPMLASVHQEFHHDPKAWEAKHGSQLFFVKQTLKRVMGLGGIV
ncbi:DUF968 domain-containing protein [Vibrio algicola]|uniref:DUF968 domain-containing protein n=1 Tax=Vibrio algicola TaxID=2662262 RepID=A0A5Q0THG0_9VIBR|nr:DUF968 domain-containing protein [Vibrio algicola]